MRPTVLLAAAILLVAQATALPHTFAQSAPGYESELRLPGRDLVPEALLRGPLHTVAEPVTVERFLGRYRIQSKFGEFDVAGYELLAMRVHELAAIENLGEIEKSAEFQQAFARAAAAPVQFVSGAFTDPSRTVESVASGLGTVLGRIGRVATTSANAIGDAASDAASSRPRPATEPSPSGEAPPPTFMGDPFGFNRARREWARRLNVDPYTTNPILRRLLDDAASATFAGELPVNLTVGLVAAPLQYAVSFDTIVRDSVWNVPIIDLVAQNERTLGAMGIAGRPVRDFFRNRWFTPTMQTALVVALDGLPDVKGRDTVVASAATLQGEARGRSFVGAVRMLGRYHKNVAPLQSIRMSGPVAVGKAADGTVVVAADLDYVAWNAETAEFAKRADLAGSKRTLLVSGPVSAKAAEALAKARWEVRGSQRPPSEK